MKRGLVVVLTGVLITASAPLLGGAVAVTAFLAGGGTGTGSAAAASPDAVGVAIPPSMLALYQLAAAQSCSGLSWTVLAAIGTVESSNGQSPLPGVHSGHNGAGAEGPMQFEPATFQRYDEPVPPGGATPPSPYDPVDAVYAAGRMLCADGAGDGAHLRQAVFAYNHSDAYVAQVLQLAISLEGAGALQGTAGGGSPATGAGAAVAFALSQVGTPYRWGGETPGVGFDCSGLVQAAWAVAGVSLPRVAQEQFDAGPLLPPEAPLQPGDLVFFGPPGGGISHVGMVVDPSGQMVDAPHSGAVVRVESFPVAVGATWGSDFYIGATRPGLV
ncbi:MAG TPA: bifunctional lytic transglycosylase/C40 family peptidase [Acidimicrobiales bacterium]